MDMREYSGDIILSIILVISTLVLVLRVWQDLIIGVSTALMMLSLAGLFLSIGKKINDLNENVASRERTIRMNLDEVSGTVEKKCDLMISDVNTIVQELSRRVYR